MSDRLTGLLVLIVALAFFASATQLEMPFFSDPLGPKAFPMLISSVAIISAIFLITKPDKEPEWPTLGTFYKLLFATKNSPTNTRLAPLTPGTPAQDCV